MANWLALTFFCGAVSIFSRYQKTWMRFPSLADVDPWLSDSNKEKWKAAIKGLKTCIIVRPYRCPGIELKSFLVIQDFYMYMVDLQWIQIRKLQIRDFCPYLSLKAKTQKIRLFDPLSKQWVPTLCNKVSVYSRGLTQTRRLKRYKLSFW